MAAGRPGKRRAALRAASKFEDQLNPSDSFEDGSTVTEVKKAERKQVVGRYSRKYMLNKENMKVEYDVVNGPRTKKIYRKGCESQGSSISRPMHSLQQKTNRSEQTTKPYSTQEDAHKECQGDEVSSPCYQSTPTTTAKEKRTTCKGSWFGFDWFNNSPVGGSPGPTEFLPLQSTAELTSDLKQAATTRLSTSIESPSAAGSRPYTSSGPVVDTRPVIDSRPATGTEPALGTKSTSDTRPSTGSKPSTGARLAIASSKGTICSKHQISTTKPSTSCMQDSTAHQASLHQKSSTMSTNPIHKKVAPKRPSRPKRISKKKQLLEYEKWVSHMNQEFTAVSEHKLVVE